MHPNFRRQTRKIRIFINYIWISHEHSQSISHYTTPMQCMLVGTSQVVASNEKNYHFLRNAPNWKLHEYSKFTTSPLYFPKIKFHQFGYYIFNRFATNMWYIVHDAFVFNARKHFDNKQLGPHWRFALYCTKHTQICIHIARIFSNFRHHRESRINSFSNRDYNIVPRV